MNRIDIPLGEVHTTASGITMVATEYSKEFYKAIEEETKTACDDCALLDKPECQKYAKEGDKILDTHFGSLSIGIACHDLGFELTAIEKDQDYYEAAKRRLKNHQRQLQLFV